MVIGKRERGKISGEGREKEEGVLVITYWKYVLRFLLHEGDTGKQKK